MLCLAPATHSKTACHLAFPHYLKEDGWQVLGFLIDLWFFVDIYLNFHTGFVHNGYIIMDLGKISEHYSDPFHGWLLIDILGSIPIDHAFSLIDAAGFAL